jgi:hypothetical protein
MDEGLEHHHESLFKSKTALSFGRKDTNKKINPNISTRLSGLLVEGNSPEKLPDQCMI